MDKTKYSGPARFLRADIILKEMLIPLSFNIIFKNYSGKMGLREKSNILENIMSLFLKFTFAGIIFFLVTNEGVLCQPPFESSDVYYHRDMTPTSWNFNSTQPLAEPCTCSCDEMLKPFRYLYNQTNDEVRLFGGYSPDQDLDPKCQKMELNINACNGYNINSIHLNLTNYSSDCFDEDFSFYYLDAQGNMTQCQTPTQNVPLSRLGGIDLVFEPPIEPCHPKTVVLFLCANCTEFSGLETANVSISLGGTPPCVRNMTFYFDFLTGGIPSPIQNGGSNEYNFGNLGTFTVNATRINNDLSYKIVDVLNTTVHSGSLNTVNDVTKIINDLNLNRGLYVLQVFEGDKILAQDKISITE